MGYGDPEAAPDIPYSFFWQEEDTNAWRRRHVSDASPGLRGARGWHRPSRRLRSPWLARQNDTAWTLGSSNWRYSSKQGLDRSEEHTSELQSLMRISYAVFCLKKKKKKKTKQ